MAVINTIIDISHYNTLIDFPLVARDGIMGVVSKATQGLGFIDPTYADRKLEAEGAGLLWGAYHFGTGSEGVSQAEFFLECVQPDQNTLLALDFEHNPVGPSMPLDEARGFVTHIRQVTGRWPLLYGGSYLREQVGLSDDHVLGSCLLWLAQYGPTPVIPRPWREWTFWQYTDGAAGNPPHQVGGVGRCDRTLFAGTREELTSLWTNRPSLNISISSVLT